ncbi:hydrolase [Streptomyces sp. NPDC093510]|uniref:COG1470 family protein n=1 Tax=Streptomyces sp. NPDC093510 TaxID=3155199 RepID=UPI00343DFC52
MSLWTSLEPASTTVDPGSGTTVRLRVRNTGDVVDAYRFEPVGDLVPWTTVEPQSLRLYPGTTGTVELTFAPPRTPDAAAGPHPYAVRITPTEHPGAVCVPEGNVTVTPFTEVRAELVPPTVKGWFRGRSRLAVDNIGNTPVTASLSGSDTGDRLGYELEPGNVRIEPGRAAFVDATLRPQQIIWFGAKQEQPYSLAVRRSGAEPLGVDGTFLQRGLLPSWLAGTLGLLLAVAIACVTIWLTYRPQMQTAAREKPQAAGKVVPAQPPPPSESAPPAQKEKPKEPPKKPDESAPEEDAGGGDGGGGEEPEETTAATAVRDLAGSSEGRHICYRAYVDGDGWQDPVCDGEEAGTAGGGKAIKALDVAVSDTQGVTGSGAYVGEGWREGIPWSDADDEEDMVIGSTEDADPAMQGFTMKVFDGSVCHDAYVRDRQWMGEVCTDPGGWKYGGSPMELNLPLEAVRFTV